MAISDTAGIREADRRAGKPDRRAQEDWPASSQLDVAEEIAPLEQKLAELREEIYKNLTPLQRVQVARSRKRPFTPTTSGSPSPTSSSCTAIARFAKTRRSSAAGRGSTARR